MQIGMTCVKRRDDRRHTPAIVIHKLFGGFCTHWEEAAESLKKSLRCKGIPPQSRFGFVFNRTQK